MDSPGEAPLGSRVNVIEAMLAAPLESVVEPNETTSVYVPASLPELLVSVVV